MNSCVPKVCFGTRNVHDYNICGKYNIAATVIRGIERNFCKNIGWGHHCPTRCVSLFAGVGPFTSEVHMKL